MITQYGTPITWEAAAAWGAARDTHPAVAMAIHAIADSTRTPEQIVADPTDPEWANVVMAVEDYLRCGECEPEDDNRYRWGPGYLWIAPYPEDANLSDAYLTGAYLP